MPLPLPGTEPETGTEELPLGLPPPEGMTGLEVAPVVEAESETVSVAEMWLGMEPPVSVGMAVVPVAGAVSVLTATPVSVVETPTSEVV